MGIKVKVGDWIEITAPKRSQPFQAGRIGRVQNSSAEHGGIEVVFEGHHHTDYVGEGNYKKIPSPKLPEVEFEKWWMDVKIPIRMLDGSRLELAQFIFKAGWKANTR